MGDFLKDANKILNSSSIYLGTRLINDMRNRGSSQDLETIYMMDIDYILQNRSILSDLFETGKEFIKSYITSFVKEKLAEVASSAPGIGDEIADIGKYAWEMSKVMLNLFSDSPVGMYRFRINPEQAKFAYKNIQKIIEYGQEKYEVQSFGLHMMDVTFNCTTGLLMPPRTIVDWGFNDIRLSYPYYKLLEFEKFYKDSKRMIMVVFFDYIFFGFLTGFDYTIDARNPRQIRYNIMMKADPKSKMHILSFDVGKYLAGMDRTFSIFMNTDVNSTINQVQRSIVKKD